MPQKRGSAITGEVDNWRWPRHTGDFAFLRAYVGPDGRPADHHVDNVPYRPVSHLKVAKSPLQPGDFVMVAGYPGRTYRHKTAAEVANAVAHTLPFKVSFYSDYLNLLETETASDEERRIKAGSLMRGLANAITYNKGVLEGLEKGGLREARAASERDLRRWINADPQRQGLYGSVLDDLDNLTAERVRDQWADEGLRRVLGAGALMRVAMVITKLAHEREKADEERAPGFQLRDEPRLVQRMSALTQQFDAQNDRAVMAFLLRRFGTDRGSAAGEAVARHRAALGIVLGANGLSNVEARIREMYENTTLSDEATRVRLAKDITASGLTQSTDPFLVLARKLYPLQKAQEADCQGSCRTQGCLGS